MTDKRWLKLACQRRSLLTFVKSKKKKKNKLCFLTSLRAPVLVTASLRRRSRVINFHLQPIFTSKREKNSAAPPWFCLAFFCHWQGDDMSMHVTEGPFWETGAATWHQNVLLNICCFVPDGEMSRKWPLFYLFIYFFWREKPFESLATANLFFFAPIFRTLLSFLFSTFES